MQKILAFVLVSFLLSSVYGQDTVFYKYNALPASNMQEALSYGILERDEVNPNQVIETKFTVDKKIISRTFYKDYKKRIKHGQQMFWNEHSKLGITKQYRNDSLHGYYREYTPEGKIAREMLFNFDQKIKDTLLISKKLDSLNTVDNLRWFEFGPIFPGCEDIEHEGERSKCTDLSIQKFIAENTKFPPELRDAGYSAKIYVEYLVNSNGVVSKIKIVKSVEYGLEMEREAVRVVGTLPKMIPSSRFGEPISTVFTIPINFVLQGAPYLESIDKAPDNDESKKQEEQYQIVEDLPVWPTCTTEVGRLEKEQCTNLAIMKFVTNSAKEKYPKELQKQEIGGRAFCRFMVNEIGDVEDVIVVKSVENATLDSIAKEIIKSFPRLAPATQDGKPVKVQYTVPVNFK